MYTCLSLVICIVWHNFLWTGHYTMFLTLLPGGNFVYKQLGCASIFRPLCYPLRSLIFPCSPNGHWILIANFTFFWKLNVNLLTMFPKLIKSAKLFYTKDLSVSSSVRYNGYFYSRFRTGYEGTLVCKLYYIV